MNSLSITLCEVFQIDKKMRSKKKKFFHVQTLLCKQNLMCGNSCLRVKWNKKVNIRVKLSTHEKNISIYGKHTHKKERKGKNRVM